MIPISGNQLKAARSIIGWDQKNLASAASLSVHTIRRLEQFKEVEIRCGLETRRKIRRAFRDAGVRFLLNGVKTEDAAKKSAP